MAKPPSLTDMCKPVFSNHSKDPSLDLNAKPASISDMYKKVLSDYSTHGSLDLPAQTPSYSDFIPKKPLSFEYPIDPEESVSFEDPEKPPSFDRVNPGAHKSDVRSGQAGDHKKALSIGEVIRRAEE
ncbi:hypothetical protein HanRHA438_Chr01g0045711 [Helianthus annuus]|nr:hypothetical protein HanRHA438_Chr01g0045711 [Helianthus annuus]